MRERGLKLYCASGTDQAYTLEEARLLEIEQYFDGRIYGALDDYKSFSKEILIRKMVSSMECRGEELVGFGDGYVEIKNVKDAGGVAVGVATDEPECVVVDQWKRERLVKVGADFIIPNFLCWKDLSGALFPEPSLRSEGARKCTSSSSAAKISAVVRESLVPHQLQRSFAALRMTPVAVKGQRT